jgi:predicted GNAT superfamily acetyltransferase
MSENVTMRVLHTMEEFAVVVELQQKIWGMAKQDTVTPYIMNAMSHNGGSIIAAEIDGQMVGFCLGFAGKRDATVLLWSHMAGVLPQYQGRSIGFLLKQEQRTWALENGYDTISWTFDPLQRGNANFNLKHLGAIVNTYHVNLYGEMTDAINAGLASDRLEATWHLHDARVVTLAEAVSEQTSATSFPDEGFLVRASDGTIAQTIPTPLTSDTYCIEIPYHISELKKHDKPQAIQWQLAVRQAMLSAFEQGYSARDFIVRDSRCWYVLRKG